MELSQQSPCVFCPKLTTNGQCIACNNPEWCCQCRPQESDVYEKRKPEPLNKAKPICSPRLCAIFGKHDEDPYEKPCELKPKKQKDGNSLGDPIGLVTPNHRLKTNTGQFEMAQIRYSTCLVAFGVFHMYPETLFDATIFDKVMEKGLMLYTASQKDNYHLISPREIYSPQEEEVLRDFEFNEYKFHIELLNIPAKSLLHIMKRNEAGDAKNTLLLKNIKAALKTILRENIYYLLCVNEFYLMLWLNDGVFFIFDLCGRNTSDFSTDEKEGVAMLMSLKTLDNVCHLILNLSGLNGSDSCTIRELKVVKLTSPLGYITQRSYGRKPPEYEILNDDYAYVTAKLHLSLNPAQLLRNRSALPAGVTALVVSKINHPATWNTKIVDNIICFGVHFCQTYWVKCGSSDPIDVEEFPTRLDIGQFRVHIELFPNKYTGFWRCIPNYKYSDLTEAIQRAFDEGYTKLLLQINYQMYAIWKQNEFIYLFDPFRHRVVGLYMQPYSKQYMGKFATVKMFLSFDVFMAVLNTILVDSNVSSPFFLHAMKIRHLQEKSKPCEESRLGTDGEVLSLNEVVCFEETDEMCRKLGEISDFEEESSEIEELELKSTSSEIEVIEEEEGNGKISLEDVEEEEGEKIKAAESTVIKVSSSMRVVPRKKNLPKQELPNLSELEVAKQELPNLSELEVAKPIEEDKGKMKDESLEDKKPKYEVQKDETAKNAVLKVEGLEKERIENVGKKKATILINRYECEKFFTDSKPFCLASNASQYPGLASQPVDMAVVGSQTGSYNSLCKLVCAGFGTADRMLVVTPWRNFVLFRRNINNMKQYFLYNGCTCNFNRFRYLKLDMGTAGLACFQKVDDMIKFMRLERNKCVQKITEAPDAYDICREYCR